MDHLFVVANHYYAVLERFGFKYLLKSPWAWGGIFAFLCFCWQGFLFTIETDRGTSLFLDFNFLPMIPLEFAIVFITRKLHSDKKKIILSRVNSKYRQNFQAVDQARRFLLRRYFCRKETEYLAFSDEIAKALSYQEQLRNPLSFGLSHLLTFLYDPDSKQRIYALLVVIVTALTALTIHEGGGISDVFAFFAGENLAVIVFVWLILVLFLAGFLMLLMIARLGVEVMWSYLIVSFDGKAARNPHTLKYLQRDLLRFHQFIPLTHIHVES